MDLYGIEPHIFAELMYKDALTLKARKAVEQKRKWQSMASLCRHDDKRYQLCYEKYKACKEAEQFNTDLLDELKYGEIQQHMEAI